MKVTVPALVFALCVTMSMLSSSLQVIPPEAINQPGGIASAIVKGREEPENRTGLKTLVLAGRFVEQPIKENCGVLPLGGASVGSGVTVKGNDVPLQSGLATFFTVI